MNKFFNWIKERWLECIAALLMILGLIFAIFQPHTGGALVGLGFGLIFYDEIHLFFSKIKEYATKSGLFKTLMLSGVFLFLLISTPGFVIASLVALAIMVLLQKHFAKKS